jgi:phosphomannomutase
VSQIPKAVIAYDSRLYSKEFAIEAATVLASIGIKTYII